MLKHLVHHHVWQRLPYGLRRSALFWGTSVLAPRPTRGATAQLPIIVAGCLRAATGLGQSARLCYQALAAEGLPVFGLDLSRAFMQPVDLPEFEFRDGAGLEGPGTLIVHVNGPLMALAMLTIGRRMVRHKKGKLRSRWRPSLEMNL